MKEGINVPFNARTCLCITSKYWSTRYSYLYRVNVNNRTFKLLLFANNSVLKRILPETSKLLFRNCALWKFLPIFFLLITTGIDFVINTFAVLLYWRGSTPLLDAPNPRNGRLICYHGNYPIAFPFLPSLATQLHPFREC